MVALRPLLPLESVSVLSEETLGSLELEEPDLREPDNFFSKPVGAVCLSFDGTKRGLTSLGTTKEGGALNISTDVDRVLESIFRCRGDLRGLLPPGRGLRLLSDRERGLVTAPPFWPDDLPFALLTP